MWEMLLISFINFVLSYFLSWRDRVGIITSPEDLHVTIAIDTKDRLEKQGTRVILRTIEPIIYGRDQVVTYPNMAILLNIQQLH